MIFNDKVDVVGTRLTSDGYLVADARIARTGIYEYAGHEVGRPDMKTVRVYRSDDEVFAQDAMASFAHKPMTNDHPPQGVTADNWKKEAVGYTDGQVARDGGFVRVPMMITDAAAIKDWQDGKRELSAGYVADFAFEGGTAPDGQAYDAVQRNIRGNHVALVSKGRAGPDCRVGDGAKPSTGAKTMELKTITVDGLPIETTDAGIAAINKLAGEKAALVTARDAAATQVGTLTATVSTKDGEIAALKAQLADAAMTPAKLDAAVGARAKVVADARRFAGAALVVDGKTDIEIKRAAVAVKLGDATMASMDDAGIAGAFTAFVGTTTADAPADPLRHVIGDAAATTAMTTADAALKVENERQASAWKGPKAAA